MYLNKLYECGPKLIRVIVRLPCMQTYDILVCADDISATVSGNGYMVQIVSTVQQLFVFDNRHIEHISKGIYSF